MGVIITQESDLGIELAKWEQFPNRFTDSPGNPYVFRPFPRMVYMAHKRANGQVRCLETEPDIYGYADAKQYERAVLETQRFNTRCTRIVQSESEYQIARNEGWRDSPQEAVTHTEGLETDIANAAAEAAAAAQGMTRKAKAELAAADAATDAHVTDVVGTPASRRGSDATPKAEGKTGTRRTGARG